MSLQVLKVLIMCNLKHFSLVEDLLYDLKCNMIKLVCYCQYFNLFILHIGLLIFKCLNRLVVLLKWPLRSIGLVCIIISMHWILTFLSQYTHLPIVLLQKHLLYPQGFCIRSGNISHSLPCHLVLIVFLSYCTSHGWLSIFCLLHRSKSFLIIVYIIWLNIQYYYMNKW